MNEKQIEERLRKEVKKTGSECLKMVCPGNAGVPDRIVLTPGGKALFVEVKAPGKKPRPIQLVTHEKLRKLGFKVYVLDSMKGIKEITNAISAS